MNKRSAMLVAAGLVLTLVVGGMAVAVGMVGPSTSAAGPRTVRQHKQPKPIVKTVKRTVKVHRSGGVVAAPASSVYGSQASSGSYGSSNSGGDQVSQHSTPNTQTSYDDHGSDEGSPSDDGSSGGDD